MSQQRNIYIVDDNKVTRRFEATRISETASSEIARAKAKIQASYLYVWALPVKQLKRSDIIITDLYPAGFWHIEREQWSGIDAMTDRKPNLNKPRGSIVERLFGRTDTSREIVDACIEIARTYLKYLATEVHAEVIVYTFVLPLLEKEMGEAASNALRKELTEAGVPSNSIFSKQDREATPNDFDEVALRVRDLLSGKVP